MATQVERDKIKALIESKQRKNLELALQLSKGVGELQFFKDTCHTNYRICKCATKTAAKRLYKVTHSFRLKSNLKSKGEYMKYVVYWHKLYNKYSILAELYLGKMIYSLDHNNKLQWV